MNITGKLLGALCLSAAVALGESPPEIEASPAEVLARIRSAVEVMNTAETLAACKEAQRLSDPVTQDGLKGMTRRENLEFRLSVLDRVAVPIDNDARKDLPSLSVTAPGVLVDGLDPKEVKDPAVRKEYERRIAENKRRSQRVIQDYVFRDLRLKWTEKVKFFVDQNYVKNAADVAEIKKAIDSTVADPALRAELEQVLRLDEK